VVAYGWHAGNGAQAARKKCRQIFQLNTLTPDHLKLETFLPLVKTRFRAGLEPANFIELELAEATAIFTPIPPKLAAKTPVQTAFSLIFHGPENHFLPQRNYLFEHDRLGRFELFVVPVGRQPGGFEYQAIINRLVQPA
jgi:hypothetical protein